jgi:enoyl-CoA hydratase/carnithine racemase
MTLSHNGSPVTLRVADSVVEIVLGRTPANALGPELIDGLNRGLDAADALPAKVIVVSSAVPGFFAAGADIKHMSSVDAESFTVYGDRLRAAVERLAAHPAVSVAAIDGLALGGGLELAMACTMRIAATGSRLGLPEVNLGLIPGAGGTQRLPLLVGRGRALDIMLTARHVDADEAHAIGLIDRLVPQGNASAAARELAEKLSTASAPALQAVVRTVNAAYDRPLPDGLAFERDQIQALFETGEAVEGIRAFLGKRAPEFA